ncbi:MAG TPA: tetraacyldisaccharide 4'-kinase [Phycisphaeraceae bacterium]
MSTDRLMRILSGADRGVQARLARAALAMLSPGYAAAVSVRNGLFDLGVRSSADLGRPTLSVGNLTVGGTGKTPMVIELAQRLLRQSVRPAVLLRGYRPRGGRAGRASSGLSDEAALLAQELGPAVPVEAGADRCRSARTVLARFPDVGAFILDDGFQHRQVRRDVDLVLIDALRPFGFDHLLPRGLLREPASSLRRASGVIVTRADQVSPDELARLDKRVADWAGKPPLAHVAYRWAALREGAEPRPIEAIGSMRVAGVSGVGNPEAFERSLRQAAGEVVWHRAMGDHHEYDARELEQLAAQARSSGVQAIVTTEKDWVKWARLVAGRPLPVPVLRPVVAAVFLDGAAAVDTLLERMVNPLDKEASR